ncbi:probable 4-coumarate--CoA ligase 3 [Malaya genurostris]|uniref:probable 4-coumarate--CoA ligase 3 n=1 Tax=Malaya genurostris TaxID=325434 RepID=UPI0026F406CB|nr:probable 4-coumarate--CoA ligase 3 [Malaya genurostris]
MLSTFNSETKVWSGLQQPPIYNPKASFGQVLFTVLRRNPEKVIQIDGDTGRTMTCKETLLRAIRAVQNLMSQGYKKGDVVAMACANSENIAPMFVALVTIGMPLNALAPNYCLDDMAHMLGITQPSLVFCDVDNYETVKKAVNLSVHQKPEIFVFESNSVDMKNADDFFKETGKENTFFPPYLGDSRALVGVILCSSGTTGLAKGVTISHAHLIAAYGNGISLGSFELIFNFSPIQWATGLYFLLQSLVNGDTRLITRKSFSEEVFYDLLEKYPIQFLLTPPSYANLILRHSRAKTADWSNIAVWGFGGSIIPEKLRNEIDRLLPNRRTCTGLGNSEIGGITTDLFRRKPNSAGQLLPNVSAKIIDDDGNVLSNGQQGELLLKFCERCLGYYNNPEATSAAIDAQGWLSTGDIGYFDEEGCLFLTDRKKDMFKCMSIHIFPADLEAVVHRIDGVEQVCVVGLPDAAGTSELPAAVIVKAKDSTLTEEDILKTVNDQVVDYKKLRGGVFFLPQLPVSITGKVLRKKVKEIVLSMIN